MKEPSAESDSWGETGLCNDFKRRNYIRFVSSPIYDNALLFLLA
jgi:hypothetical protein